MQNQKNFYKKTYTCERKQQQQRNDSKRKMINKNNKDDRIIASSRGQVANKLFPF